MYVPLLTPRAIFAQTSIERDQQALTILTQAIAAGGGPEQLAAIQDLTETGTVTYDWAVPDSGNVTVKGRGLHQFRVDANLQEGMWTTIVNGESGLLMEANGSEWPVQRQTANDLGSLVLPYLPLIAATQNSSTNIIYGGLVTLNGASLYDVRLQKSYTSQQDPSGNRGAREARDFYIDPQTYLVAAISDRIHFGVGPKDEGIPHEILYSNYQAENGIMAPLTITETFYSATEFTMTLTQFTCNSGLTDSDFTW